MVNAQGGKLVGDLVELEVVETRGGGVALFEVPNPVGSLPKALRFGRVGQIDTESLEDGSRPRAFHDVGNHAIGIEWFVEESIHLTDVSIGFDEVNMEHLTHRDLIQETLDGSGRDGVAMDGRIIGIRHPDGSDPVVLGFKGFATVGTMMLVDEILTIVTRGG